jgi:cell division protein FtsB
MSDRPLIVSLLIGLIVVLVIAGVSVLVRMNSVSDTYKKEVGKNMSLQKTIEILKEEKAAIQGQKDSLVNENNGLKENNAALNAQIDNLRREISELQSAKEALEKSAEVVVEGQ